MIDRKADPRELTFLEESVEGVLEEMDLKTESHPDQCAICGQWFRDIEEPDQMLPISVFPGVAELFTNSDAIEVSDQTHSLRLRFCNEHWTAILNQAEDPGKLPLQSIDGEYVGQHTITEDQRFLRDPPAWRKAWDQNRIRLARRIAYYDHELDIEGPRKEVEAALLVAAVDGYGIEYGPVETDKDSLAETLQDHGLDAERLLHPSFDIEVEFEDTDQEVVGSVFRIPEETGRFTSGMLSEHESTPEQRVSNTEYLRLTGKSYHESVEEEDGAVQYVDFYWLAGRDQWVWYPFKPDHDTDFFSDDRLHLPVDGPTEMIPALPISELSAETSTPEGYEQRLRERWKKIEQSRPLIARFKDRLLRKLRQ
ncbi:hypothetical protein [Halobacterium salinarum]|uniref:hypothetical protein n=1 Tax=Halobacterium salinarum TaxID=2242 RepID=UPI002552E6E0|nr:hypothetical protein [Halobacterium salinarum]MDL0126619.1 hypothetical protein [Halobacterium salinarum]